MKNLILAFSLIAFLSCKKAKTETSIASLLGSGACKKCKCQSWRSDSGKPEKCINIRVPTKKLCKHLKKDHK